jgi:type IV pilus biogenesis protein CpaD/CtpE
MQRTTRTKLTAFFCLTLATAGCAGDPDRAPGAQAVADTINVVFHHGKWRQVPATPENQAEVIVFEQRVNFAPETALLDRSARQAIDRLLAEADPQPGALIRLSVPGSREGTATFDRLTLQRLESVRGDLTSRGYESALADNAVARVGSLAEHEIGLTVSRMMAVLPDCDAPQPLEPDPPVFERGFGCANAYNLGAMIDDPADLERGRTLDPADAEKSSLSVLRYRLDDDESESLEEESTKSQ